MCIRYDKASGEPIKWSKAVKAWIPLTDWTEGRDTYPGYIAPIVVPDWGAKGRAIIPAKWGLQPHWAKDARYGVKYAYNARSESVFEKPTFRVSVRKFRCLVPAVAFYEQPAGRWLRMRPRDAEEFAIAGLYLPPREELVPESPDRHVEWPTYTLVTTVPTAEIAATGHDRMPLVLRPCDYDAWLDLDTPTDHVRALMIPPPDGTIEIEDAGPTGRKKQTDARLLE